MKRLIRSTLLALYALALAGVAAAQPAAWATTFGGAIGTPVELGKSSITTSSNPQTVTTTTIADGPAGNTNFIIAAQVGNANWSAAYNNDSAGNSYGLSGYNQNTVDLPNGGSFSTTWSCSLSCSPNPSVYQVAYNISGLVTSGAADTVGATSGSGTSVSVTESAPTKAVRIGMCSITVTGGASDTFTPTNGWTEAQGSPVTLAAKDAMHVMYLKISNASAQACTATLGTSRTWAASVTGFDGK